MNDRKYWLTLFTETTWREFLIAGSNTAGFHKNRWKTVQQIKPGDFLICYLTRLSSFVGILEVVTPAFKDSTPIWKGDDFPNRLGVRIHVALTPETAVPIRKLSKNISFLNNMGASRGWTGRFRMSPARWEDADGEAVLAALNEAQKGLQTRRHDSTARDRKL